MTSRNPLPTARRDVGRIRQLRAEVRELRAQLAAHSALVPSGTVFVANENMPATVPIVPLVRALLDRVAPLLAAEAALAEATGMRREKRTVAKRELAAALRPINNHERRLTTYAAPNPIDARTRAWLDAAEAKVRRTHQQKLDHIDSEWRAVAAVATKARRAAAARRRYREKKAVDSISSDG